LDCITARALGISARDIHYWADSMNCLYWINFNMSSLNMFVANRVVEIHRLSDIPQWRQGSCELRNSENNKTLLEWY
jgi:hypothetical protein